jgi:hypothetical protein
MSGKPMSDRFNRCQHSSFAILVIAVLQKAIAFVQPCNSCISFIEMLNGKLCITLKIPFVRRTFLSSLVKRCMVGFDQAVVERAAKRFENFTLVLKHQGNSFSFTVSY